MGKREDKQTQESFSKKPFVTSIVSVDPGKEQLEVDSAVGPDTVDVPHPMLGPNSWIRSLPEKGASVITATVAGGRTFRRNALGYASRVVSELIERYNAGRGLYKQLKMGEWELLTPGVSHIYGTVEGKLNLRGGVVHSHLDPKSLERWSRSPTHTRQLHQKLDSELMDEERFGVVHRNLNSTKKHRWIRVPLEGVTDETDSRGNVKTTSFAKEYGRIFGRDGTRLAAYQEGDCFDDTGDQLKQSFTGKNLRCYREYYHKDGSVAWQQSVDEEGNMGVSGVAKQINVDESAADTTLKLSKLLIELGRSLNIQAETSVDIRGQTTGRYSGKTSTILGPDPAPANAAIKGNQFNTTVMVPFFQALVACFNTMAAELGPAGFTNSQAALTTASSALLALATLLAPSLSTNVKISQ